MGEIFLPEKLNKFAINSNNDYEDILCKRSLGMYLATFIVHKISPNNYSSNYPSIADCIKAIIGNISLPQNSLY